MVSRLIQFTMHLKQAADKILTLIGVPVDNAAGFNTAAWSNILVANSTTPRPAWAMTIPITKDMLHMLYRKLPA
jgi:hypothetical protein